MFVEVRYFDTVTIKHKDTKHYLYSWDAKYPLQYDDGRISSQGELSPSFLQSDAHLLMFLYPTL